MARRNGNTFIYFLLSKTPHAYRSQLDLGMKYITNAMLIYIICIELSLQASVMFSEKFITLKKVILCHASRYCSVYERYIVTVVYCGKIGGSGSDGSTAGYWY